MYCPGWMKIDGSHNPCPRFYLGSYQCQGVRFEQMDSWVQNGSLALPPQALQALISNQPFHKA